MVPFLTHYLKLVWDALQYRSNKQVRGSKHMSSISFVPATVQIVLTIADWHAVFLVLFCMQSPVFCIQYNASAVCCGSIKIRGNLLFLGFHACKPDLNIRSTFAAQKAHTVYSGRGHTNACSSVHRHTHFARPKTTTEDNCEGHPHY